MDPKMIGELNIPNFIKTLALFNLGNRFLKKQFSKKQSENIISGIHALSSLYFSGTNDIYNLRWLSIAYFFHDFIQMFFSKKLNIMKLAYMYHHLSAIYILSCDSTKVPIREIMFWGELSNLSNYPLYYLLHRSNSNTDLINFFRTLQKFLFTSIRIPIFTSGIIQYLINRKTNKHLFAMGPVYLMGLIWSIKILKQPYTTMRLPWAPRLANNQDTFLD
jgi:hypothetical protein